MSINDTIIKRTENYYQDEFERSVAHRADTVAFFWANYSNIVLAAALAWIIPGQAAYFSFLALIPTALGGFIASRWMRTRIPTPQLRNLSHLKAIEWVFLGVTLAAWILGLGKDTPLLAQTPTFVGAIVGVVAALVALPLISKAQRARDERRLASNEED
ncbi:hypothetical protein [Corynebacterium epidermidicanis]|uniref:Uncharacterized protein n=1 Tax=Corynebacterium epidermidicanis TaxID=1050174 RepID=A0A0G3GVD4_9CORY|nr:hypothetical protein [Corynebacterium epidermidicanis]AKK02812.1 hypothetical protein CEPID_04710 [Corynebacterium epidermidicanis]